MLSFIFHLIIIGHFCYIDFVCYTVEIDIIMMQYVCLQT